MTRRFLLSSLLLAGAAARADVKPHALFSEGAVLQRDTEVPVWGFSDKEGEKVTVTLDGVAPVETVAHDGMWRVTLPAQKVGAPRTLTIKGDNEVVVKDLLFGEVWICSGQSNMEMNFSTFRYGVKITEAEKQMKASSVPGLRLFNVGNATAAKPLKNVSGKWQHAAPESVRTFSLTGQYFGRELKKALGEDVPVGLIESDWGGTRAESWTGRAGLAKNPAHAKELAAFDKSVETFAEVVKKAADAKTKAAKVPSDPVKNPNAPAVLHNAMIAPLVPYAFRGVIWYQGEANNGKAKEYRTTFPAMIADWRAEWGRGDFPFLFVQIAPFKGMSPEIREAQLLSLKASPNTAMVQTIDVGEANNIHPWNKEPVGVRLALAARALAYHEKVEYSGPLFAGAEFAGGKAIVSFTHADSGLELKTVKPGDFQVAGSDGKFVAAEAAIEGDKLVVSAAGVSEPKAVRYGWSNVPNAALWNKSRLPASPFRSDVE